MQIIVWLFEVLLYGGLYVVLYNYYGVTEPVSFSSLFCLIGAYVIGTIILIAITVILTLIQYALGKKITETKLKDMRKTLYDYEELEDEEDDF